MGRQKMAVTHVVRLLVLFMLVGVVDSMIRSVHPLPSWFTDFFSKRQAEDVAVMFAAQATKHIAPSTAVEVHPNCVSVLPFGACLDDTNGSVHRPNAHAE